MLEALVAVVVYLLLLFLVLPLAVLILWVWRPFHLSKRIPGPPAIPVIGMFWFPMRHWANWPTVCDETSRQFHHATWGGPCLRYGAIFYTDHPANVKHILKDNFSNYEKGALWRSIFREILGNGIFNADGEIWASHRKISAKLFSPNLLRHSCRAVDRNCRIMMQLFDEAIDNNNAALDKHDNGKEEVSTVDETTSAVVDLQDLFLRFTIDNTAETTFGFVMQSLQAKRQSSFAAGFDELQDLCLARLIDPLFEVKRTFQLTTAERRIRTLQRELRQFCKTIINDKRRAIRAGGGGGDGGGGCDDASLSSSHEDLLGLFIRYGTKHADDAQEVEALTDVILNFMVAGRDTTAAALSWTFYELSKHPTVVQLIIEEAAQVFGPVDDDDADTVEPLYTYDGLNRLKYTHCVVLEALRLHPPVPVDSKFAIHSDTLPDGTYIPAKSLISYMPHAMGHNEQIFGLDVMEFKPERFFNNATTTTEPSPFSFSVFNAGPRLCLGKPLAMLTMKMVLVQLLPRFEFHDTMGHPGTMKWSMVGKMKDGFPVQVSRRRSCKRLDGSIDQHM